MGRIGRAVVPGVAHHITQRGNYRRAVFEEDTDRRRYLEWLGHYAERYDTLFCIWVEQFQKCTRSGRPFGKEAFVSQVERSLRRNLKAPPLGLPRNKGK